MTPLAVPVRRQGPITGLIAFPCISFETAKAEDGPLPSQGHGGFWVGGQS